MTLMLKDGKWLYDLPMGVIEVINYHDYQGHSGGSNHTYDRGGPQQLFSMDNAMYMGGFMNANMGGMGMGMQAFNLIGYESARQYMGMLEHYEYNEYHWTYHKSTNQLQISPFVPCDPDDAITLATDDTGDYRIYENIDCSSPAMTGETTFSSPGFVLLRTQMIEGASLPTYVPPTSGDIQNTIFDIADSYLDWMYSETWIKEYVTALSMITLGRIRRKFSSFSALGNQGISLDGADLISEGTTEKDRLELELDEKHAYEGFGITIG
jgi:hypothetical protein